MQLKEAKKLLHPLTIVLPLHNAENFVEKSVREILDETQSFDSTISIVLVDDGSTDDTYELACQLSRYFPQVKAVRQPVRKGLAAAVELVRKRITTERILMHDGVTPIFASHLNQMLQGRYDQADDGFSCKQDKPSIEAQGSRQFSAVSTLNNSLHRAHQPVLGFQWLPMNETVSAGRRNRAKIRTTTNPAPSAVIPLATAPNLMAVQPNSVI